MSKKAKKEKTVNIETEIKLPALSPTKMEYWRELAAAHSSDGVKSDKWEVSALATALHGMVLLLGRDWERAMKAISRCGNKGTIAVGLTVDRTQSPQTATMSVTFTERYRDKMKLAVPDPNALELPLDDSVGPEED